MLWTCSVGYDPQRERPNYKNILFKSIGTSAISSITRTSLSNIYRCIESVHCKHSCTQHALPWQKTSIGKHIVMKSAFILTLPLNLTPVLTCSAHFGTYNLSKDTIFSLFLLFSFIFCNQHVGRSCCIHLFQSVQKL